MVMVQVASPAKLRPWSELIAKMVMGVVPGLVNNVTANCCNFRAATGVSRYTPPTLTKKEPIAPVLPPPCQCRGDISLQNQIALHGCSI